MAYGKENARKYWDHRALPLGVGQLTESKQTDLLSIYVKVVDLMQHMASSVFNPDPLFGISTPVEIDQYLYQIQKEELNLNSCWAEQARMRVKPVMVQQNNRYFKQLIGRLRFVDSLNTFNTKKQDDLFIGPPKPVNKYINIPFAIQDNITNTEIAELKSFAENKKGTELFERVIVHDDTIGLTKNQIIIIKHIHSKVKEQHKCPSFATTEQFTLQLHLTPNMLPTVKQKGKKDKLSEAKQLRDGEVAILKDNKNRIYQRFIDISGVKSHGSRIRIPARLTRDIAKRITGTNPNWASLIIEITANPQNPSIKSLKVGVRLVCGKPPEPPTVDLSKVTTIIGRDFGYTNTISLSIVNSLTPVDLTQQTTDSIRIQSQKDAKLFFETHSCPDNVTVIEQINYSGNNFLKLIDDYCLKIDSFNSRIDIAYVELNKLHVDIVDQLKLVDGQILPEYKKSIAGNQVRNFFALLGKINDFKKNRRRLYKKIAAIKKNWFGFLSNKEVELAQKHGAIIVRENLTVEAIEKESPEYKGRRFNKMINNGSKGQYQKMASGKFKWNGIPEVLIGSWYTSRVCTKHAVIAEKKDRKGEKLYLSCCDCETHADIHASETIAKYHFLIPNTRDIGSKTPVSRNCDKHNPMTLVVGSPVL